MTTQTEALKLALEALKNITNYEGLADAREAIKEVLAQPEQEPVAWWIPKAEQFCLPSSDGTRPFAKAWEPLYTTPPQRTWVGLTDEEYKNLHLQMGSMYFYQDYGRAIESKLKEKNT